MISSDRSPLARLQAIGFSEVGEWRAGENCLRCELIQHPNSKNVLYAFVSSDEVLYVGKTVVSLRSRMKGYERPGPTQRTNFRSKAKIAELIAAGQTVKVFALPDNGLLRYGGFHVNLAAGLEDSIVRELKPRWNIMGAS